MGQLFQTWVFESFKNKMIAKYSDKLLIFIHRNQKEKLIELKGGILDKIK